MKISKIFAGMSAAAIVASMMSMATVSAADEEFYVFATNGDWADASVTVAADAESATITWDAASMSMKNLGYIGNAEGKAVDVSVNVDSITVNNEYTVDVDVTLVGNGDASANGLANIWNDFGKAEEVYLGDGCGFYGDGGENITFKVGNETVAVSSLTYNFSEAEDPSDEVESWVIPVSELNGADANTGDFTIDNTYFLAGDEEKGEAGLFNGKLEELNKVTAIVYTVSVDPEVAATFQSGDVWMGGCTFYNSKNTGWVAPSFSFQDDQENTFTEVSEGVYQITLSAAEGDSIFHFDAADEKDNYAQVGIQSWAKEAAGADAVKIESIELVGIAAPAENPAVPEEPTVPAVSFNAFLMFTDANWGWGNWAVNDGTENGGKGTDAEITGDDTYTVSISADQVAAWYDADGNEAEAGADGATAAHATGASVFGVDIVGLADAIGANSEDLGKDATCADKMALAKDAGLTISNVKILVDGAEAYAYDDADLLYGDIEGNGNIRLEIFNVYGETGGSDGKADPTAPEGVLALVEDLDAAESIEVQFDIAGIPEKVEPTNPSDDDNKPADDDNQPSDDDNKPADDDNQPSDEDNKPADEDNKPADDDKKPSSDSNPATGSAATAALATVGVLLAGAAVVVSKKK